MGERALVPFEATQHVLDDGLRVLVRPVVPTDRAELEAGYRSLSTHSRQTRFFSPPKELSEDDLDYLTNVDQYDHCALAAFAADEPGAPGLGVARYIREEGRPTHAEVAVTVLDDYQHRGIGTLLMRLLASVAATNGVRTLVSYVQWDNGDLIEQLREEGARVLPDEAGVARIELDIPHDSGGLPDSSVRQIIGMFTERLRSRLSRSDRG